MTSKELHQQIAAFVADGLDEQEYRSRARTAVRPCEDCGRTFTRDLAARLALSGSGRQEPPPDERGGLLENGVEDRDEAAERTALREHAPTQQPGALERVLGDLVSPAGIVLAALALVLAAGWMVRSEETVGGLTLRTADEAVPVEVTASQPQNLFNEAVRVFALLRRGEMEVQVPGEKRLAVEEYFAANGVGYSARFPNIALPLTGGIVSRYGDRAFAQLVYSSKDRAVYVFEVPTTELREGKRLYVTQDILERLERGERIRELTSEGESLVMFRDGDLVITAVGNMEPEELSRFVRGA